jgi:hypothetical protein
MIIKPEEAPGQKIIKKLPLETKWMLCSATGLALIGLGLCLFSEIAYVKHQGAQTSTWVIFGTFSLVIINSGIAIFGKAVVYKTEIRSRDAYRERQKGMKNRRNKKKTEHKKTLKKEG